jgi:hypothetical protein
VSEKTRKRIYDLKTFRNIIQFEWRKGRLTKINKRETERDIWTIEIRKEKRLSTIPLAPMITIFSLVPLV